MKKRFLGMVVLVVGLSGMRLGAQVKILSFDQGLRARDKCAIKMICTNDWKKRDWYREKEQALFEEYQGKNSQRVFFAGEYAVPKMEKNLAGKWQQVNPKQVIFMRPVIERRCRVYYIIKE